MVQGGTVTLPSVLPCPLQRCCRGTMSPRSVPTLKNSWCCVTACIHLHQPAPSLLPPKCIILTCSDADFQGKGIQFLQAAGNCSAVKPACRSGDKARLPAGCWPGPSCSPWQSQHQTLPLARRDPREPASASSTSHLSRAVSTLPCSLAFVCQLKRSHWEENEVWAFSFFPLPFYLFPTIKNQLQLISKTWEQQFLNRRDAVEKPCLIAATSQTKGLRLFTSFPALFPENPPQRTACSISRLLRNQTNPVISTGLIQLGISSPVPGRMEMPCSPGKQAGTGRRRLSHRTSSTLGGGKGGHLSQLPPGAVV